MQCHKISDVTDNRAVHNTNIGSINRTNMSYLESMRNAQKSQRNPIVDNISKVRTEIPDQQSDYP